MSKKARSKVYLGWPWFKASWEAHRIGFETLNHCQKLEL
ncbi:hypothetical protein Tco_1330496, partial [Tanacetum coccineum]